MNKYLAILDGGSGGGDGGGGGGGGIGDENDAKLGTVVIREQ